MTVAERWFYFPMVGFLGLIGVIASEVWQSLLKSRFPRPPTYVGVLGMTIIVILLSIRSYQRNLDRVSEFMLFSHDLEISKESYDLENGLAVLLFQSKKYDEALTHAEKSIALFPYATNYNTLGLIYLQKRDYKNARINFQKAVDFGDYYISYQNMSDLYLVDGDINEAKAFNQQALQRLPYNAKLWLDLAVIKYRLGQLEEAKAAALKSYELDSNDTSAYVYNSLINNKPLNLNFKVESE